MKISHKKKIINKRLGHSCFVPQFYKIAEYYDGINTDIRSVYYYLSSHKNKIELENLAAYIQFKTDICYDYEIHLVEEHIAKFLVKYGAKSQPVTFDEPQTFDVIDLYESRNARCGDWFNERFNDYDIKFGLDAERFLMQEVQI
ncbi:MAG: hypothetical protein HRU38_23330 [Saccharospirillaceae bacterium]|nr:hypothetical protein [Saccharospirillaceae bacterium]